MESNVLFAFSLTLFAGLATGLGSIIALLKKNQSTKFLSGALGFSAGVMIYVSFIEIFSKARGSLEEVVNPVAAYWITLASFFGGILFIALIDKLIPKAENLHEFGETDKRRSKIETASSKRKLLQMGVFTALAITIHNFPEGLATFITGLEDPQLAIAIAIAIAIHNIPEGIAVSVPIYYATGSRKKAFIYSFLSGLSEPIGAILGYTILRPFINDFTFGIVFAAVAGIMVFISFDQLLPMAEEYGEHHMSVYGLVFGMAVMGLSLVLAF